MKWSTRTVPRALTTACHGNIFQSPAARRALDRKALTWHVLGRDLWFLLLGLTLAATTRTDDLAVQPVRPAGRPTARLPLTAFGT